MHPGSPSDPCGTATAEAKPRYAYSILTTWSEFQKASQTTTEQGNAELHIINFKTTWSDFQKPSQTATEQSKAELRILDFKTTWSEFQKPSPTAVSAYCNPLASVFSPLKKKAIVYAQAPLHTSATSITFCGAISTNSY